MELHNKLEEYGEKEKEGNYETVEIDGIELSTGDLIVWSDPDVGMHAGECELIHSSEWVVQVTKLRIRWNQHKEEYELLIGNTGVGSITWDDIAIPNKKDNWTVSADDADHLVETFKNDDQYDRYMYWEYHTGEDGCPTELWEIYEDQEYGNSGPNCPICMDNGVKIAGR